MSTKMKGLLKGLRYISHMFDEKEPEMQIGLPTDVKHVAHIGWDGQSVDSPSWMDKFESPRGGFQSAPLVVPDSQENPEIKWVSEDPSRRSSRSQNSPGHEISTKSIRRRSSSDGNDSPRKDKSRHSRRHHSKDSSSDINKSSRHLQLEDDDGNVGSDLSSRNLPDIPKRSRKKKPKDSSDGGSSTRSRLRGTSSKSRSSYSDPAIDTGSSVRSSVNETCQPSKMDPLGTDS